MLEHIKESFDIGLRQACCRLVEYQEVGLHGERPGNGDERSLGSRQFGDVRRRINLQADAIERSLGVVSGRRPVDHAEGSFEATDESHVLGNRHAIDQTVILVDEREMIVPMMVERLLPEPDRTAVRLMDPGQELDECRLARTVLAEKRQDLSALDGQGLYDED